MSTAVAKNFQVGSDSTATNNFTIRQPATPDGTVRIANGNSGTTTDLVTVTSAGNVGVGTTSPAAKLEVNGAVVPLRLDGITSLPSNQLACYVGPISDTAGGGINGDLALIPRTSAAGSIVFATGTTTPSIRMKLDSSGNLGLGTSSPAYKLDVVGPVQSSSGYYINGNASGGYVWVRDNYALRFGTNDTERMRLDSSGNLGIGTSSPAAKLHVAGGNIRLNDNQGVEWGGGTNFIYGSNSTNILVFTTNNTERARITSGGAVLVNTTSGAYTGAGCVNSEVSTSGDFCFSGVNTNSTNPRGLYLRNTNTTAGDYAIYFEASAATKFYVNGNGVIYSTNTSVQSVSDARHKENVRDLDKGLAEVLALKPRRFDWKEGKGTGAKDVAGFIAQEVEAVLPELVGEWKESIDAEETFKSIGMANVIPMLVKAIQELKAELDSVKTELALLKGTA